jgi:hypothetical protein
MNANFIYLYLLLLLANGCNFIEIPTPDNKIEAADVFKQDKTATDAVKTIYALMVDGNASSYLTSLLTGLQGDELNNVSNNDLLDIYKNNIAPANVYASAIWTAAYYYIYLANAAYEGCKKSSSLDPAIRKQLMAEALFIRAYWYFYLSNLYGDIPLPTTISYKANAILPRSPIAKVHEQIITDLITAQNDLHMDYVGPDSKPASNERVRPNKATATALLARVYLYMGRYSDAEIQATSLIDANSNYSLVPLEAVFLKNSKEAIWQLMAATPNLFNINTHEGAEFILMYSPLMTRQSVLDSQLLRTFENGDLRKSAWIGSYTDTTGTYFYPYKYKIRSGSDLEEYTMVFRLSEQYLIRAEARTHLHRLSAAISDIDIIRKRAGLPLLSHTRESMNETDLMKAILQERQTELFTEGGHRWFDLKRTGNIDTVMNAVCRSKKVVWKPDMQLWPIPVSELSMNPNLIQNKGY